MEAQLASTATRGSGVWPRIRATGTRIVATVLETDSRISTTLLRIALAAILFPHGAQHALGWFGGYGFGGTHLWMTETLGFPAVLAAAAIAAELLAPIALLAGAAGRVAALAVAGIMLGAIKVHAADGFFMNWFGQLPAGAEGFEYHLLVLAMAVVLVMEGSGALSVDGALRRRPW